MNFKTDRPNSIRFRLLASTALLVAIILPITAFALTSYYRIAVEQTFDQRLKVHLDNLIALSLRQSRDDRTTEETEASSAVEMARGAVEKTPEAIAGEKKVIGEELHQDTGRKVIELGEPLFKRPFSGWYWQIRALDGAQKSIAISDSLLDQRISALPDSISRSSKDGLKRGYIEGPEGQMLRAIERVIIAGGDEASGEKGQRLDYIVAISASQLEEQVAQFRNMLLLALGLLGAGLILAGFMQVRYGLAPLFVISRKLNDIRAGKADRLSGSFPAEIEPLQTALNALIRSNKDVVERARTHVGNLAHALKTPLSVISNETDQLQQEEGGAARKFALRIGKQTQIMNDQVRHHLDRARMAAQIGIIGNATEIEPVMKSLSRTLQKIYKEKNIEISCDCSDQLLFRGERQDLEEMLGNLLDNAFKWADSRVTLSISQSEQKPDFLLLGVDDDGPGLSASKRAQAMKRGQRLDENLPGSGLGLSIVADLAHLYGGGFRLESSEFGGLRAELLLPLASSSS